MHGTGTPLGDPIEVGAIAAVIMPPVGAEAAGGRFAVVLHPRATDAQTCTAKVQALRPGCRPPVLQGPV